MDGPLPNAALRVHERHRPSSSGYNSGSSRVEKLTGSLSEITLFKKVNNLTSLTQYKYLKVFNMRKVRRG